MTHPSNVSYPRSEYYRKYYLHNKYRYRMNYEEKKYRQECFNEIYKPFGGERKYYTNCILNWIKQEQEDQIVLDLSNINLN